MDISILKKFVRQRDFRGVRDFVFRNPEFALHEDCLPILRKLNLRSGDDSNLLRQEIWQFLSEKYRHDSNVLANLLRSAVERRGAGAEALDIFEILVDLTENNFSKTEFRNASIAMAEYEYIYGDQENRKNLIKFYSIDSKVDLNSCGLRLALSVDQGDFSAAAEEMGNILQSKNISDASRIVVSNVDDLWRSRVDRVPVSQDFYLIIFTHAASKFKINKQYCAPSVEMIADCVRSIKNSILSKKLRGVKIYHDHNGLENSEKYKSNLEGFCLENGFDLIVSDSFGLRRQWIRAFDESQGDILLIVEHDHIFLDPPYGWSEMRKILNDRWDLNYLRMNRRGNIKKGFDTILHQGEKDKSQLVCRTSRFSNTPHFHKVDFYNNIVKPIISNEDGFDGGNGGAAGVEENVNRTLRRLEEEVGLPATIALLGNALMRTIGAPRAVQHVGV